MGISGLTHAASASALLRFAFRVAAHAQGWLPAGWLAFTGRVSNPLDHYERFPITWSSPSPVLLTLPRFLTTYCVCLELRPLPSTGVTQLQRYYEPLRQPQGARPVPHGLPVGRCSDHAMGLPVLRTLSLCTCCRHYPGAASGRMIFARNPAVSAFPERVVGWACASSFSRLARRSLALRPAQLALSPIRDTLSEGFSQFVTSLAAPAASDWSDCRVGLHPLESAALSRRIPKADIELSCRNVRG